MNNNADTEVHIMLIKLRHTAKDCQHIAGHGCMSLIVHLILIGMLQQFSSLALTFRRWVIH